MKLIKAKIKTTFHGWVVMMLLAANVMAFTATHSFFTKRQPAEGEQNKDFVSTLYTGWQMLDWSFSLIDYFNNVGDRKSK